MDKHPLNAWPAPERFQFEFPPFLSITFGASSNVQNASGRRHSPEGQPLGCQDTERASD